MNLIGFLPMNLKNCVKDLNRQTTVNLSRNIAKKYNTSLKEKIPPWYTYTCYQCKKVNHGTPVYQTNSLNDYQRHWISSEHKGPCQPNLIDCEHHGWEPQGKEWETS